MALIYRLALIAVSLSCIFYMGICVALYFAQSKLIFPSNMVGLTTGSPRIKIVSDDGVRDIDHALVQIPYSTAAAAKSFRSLAKS